MIPTAVVCPAVEALIITDRRVLANGQPIARGEGGEC